MLQRRQVEQVTVQQVEFIPHRSQKRDERHQTLRDLGTALMFLTWAYFMLVFAGIY